MQKPTPPIWIGANADVAIRRAARLGDCWYINPHNTLATIERQMDLYKRALDECGRRFPDEVPMRREVFVAKTRAEAIRLAQPYLEEKYKAYRAWGQDKVMPDGDDFDHAFDELLQDRFLLGSPAEVADQLHRLNRRLGVNHLVASIHWPGMPNSLALEQLHILAEEVRPLVRATRDGGTHYSAAIIRSSSCADRIGRPSMDLEGLPSTPTSGSPTSVIR